MSLFLLRFGPYNSPRISTGSSETACPSSGSSNGRLAIVLAASVTSFQLVAKAVTNVPEWYLRPRPQPSNLVWTIIVSPSADLAHHSEKQ